jgi:hypothetical protein
MMKEEWKHFATCGEGKSILVDGVDVWKHEWQATESRGKVKDPIYGQDFVFHVYMLTVGGKQIEFAAGEFASGVFGISRRERA